MKIRILCVGIGIAMLYQPGQAQTLRTKGASLLTANQEQRLLANLVAPSDAENNAPAREAVFGIAYTVDKDDGNAINTPFSFSYRGAESRWKVGVQANGYKQQHDAGEQVKRGWDDFGLVLSYTFPSSLSVGLAASLPTDTVVGSKESEQKLSLIYEKKYGSWSVRPTFIYSREEVDKQGMVYIKYLSFKVQRKLERKNAVWASVERSIARGEATSSTAVVGYDFVIRETAPEKGWSGSLYITYNFNGQFKKDTIKFEDKGVQFDLTYAF